MRCLIVASTGGGVMNQLLHDDFFRSQMHGVVSDRACGALEKAAAHGVPTRNFAEPDRQAFSDALLAYARAEGADYLISFYTKLFVGELVDAYADRIVNLHPSILPAFPGLRGFEDALAAGVRYCGTTIHFIDARMDAGKTILQSVLPIDPQVPAETLRHRLFVQQCRSLLQVVHWLAEGRVSVRGERVEIARARYGDFEFSPALEAPSALALEVPQPGL